MQVTASTKVKIVLFIYLFLFLIHFIEEYFHRAHIASISIDVVEFSLFVEDLIVGEAIHLQELFDGTLLFCGQIVVNNVVARQVVCLDNVLPFFIRSTVRQIEIDDIVVFSASFSTCDSFKAAKQGSHHAPQMSK